MDISKIKTKLVNRVILDAQRVILQPDVLLAKFSAILRNVNA
jgi:hypothetical protein